MTGPLQRNNVQVTGNGEKTLLFAHGFGCDQNAWQYLKPYLQDHYKLVFFDYVGAGKSDVSAYDRQRYASLDGYATDLIEICEALELEHTVFVGHSVSCMIGLLAAIRRPSLFSAMILLGPSPRYINDANYQGGFDAETIDTLMDVMEKDYISWARSLAPAIMDPANGEKLGEELTNSFCYIDPMIARQFARVTFLGDNRNDLPKAPVKSLTIVCAEDMISPLPVAAYIQRHMPGNSLVTINGRGHCPHMSHPAAVAKEIIAYLSNA